MLRWLVVCLAGCGRIDFDPVPTSDAPADGADSSALIAHWQFEDVPGDGALDATGNGHTARCFTTCPTLEVAGKRGAGYRFDGTASMLEVTDAPDLHIAGPLTLALWLNWVPNGNEVSLIGKRFGTTFRNSFQLTVLPTGALHVCTTESDTVGRCDDSATDAVPDNVFVHVAYVFDGESHVGYINGVEVVRAATGIAFDTGALYLGGDIDDTTPLFFLRGVLDDIRIYGRALPVAELQELAAP